MQASFLVVLLIAFHKKWRGHQFRFGMGTPALLIFLEAPELWLHFSSLITYPHAPFIYQWNWKKVIGPEAVLTCPVGYSSGNPSSGFRFPTNDSSFPLRSQAGWAIYHKSSDCLWQMPGRCSYQVGAWKTTCKMDPLKDGDGASSSRNGWEAGLWEAPQSGLPRFIVPRL